jgi:hypothetical protein
MEWENENIEDFIKSHRDKFDTYRPELNHHNRFLKKLYNKFKKLIDITPYLVKVGIIGTIITIFSFFIWKQYLCPPLTHISLHNYKIEHVYKYEICSNIRNVKKYIETEEEKAEFKLELQNFNDQYKNLNKALRKEHSAKNAMNVVYFYKAKLEFLNNKIENYKSINKQ